MAVEQVTFVEVSPRDGLQSDDAMVSTADKVELITRLVSAGLTRIEAVSFVNPKRVPQMADAEAVMARLPRIDGVSYIGLVLNRRGFDRALAAGVDEVNSVVVVTDTFSQKNQGMPTAESVNTWADIAGPARDAGLFSSVTVSAAFGCPYEGAVSAARVREVIEAVAQSAPDEIALADTIGAATPNMVRERIAIAQEVAPNIALRCHFHNTRNTGLANVLAAVEAGVSVIDASLGGIGGCPFAPAATGNIPTEDTAYMLEGMGISTGLDLGALIDLTAWLEGVVAHAAPGMLAKAGLFPPDLSTGPVVCLT
ncbi:MAG: hydroxymethylglutaryl-CoA lyase [Actinobacteria bacterium]|nr:hydroxymethylglutaryl-CoA lyase [Actinomycetota bacterium]